MFGMAGVKATVERVMAAITEMRRAGHDVQYDNGRVRHLGRLKHQVGGGTLRVRACAILALGRERPGSVPFDLLAEAHGWLGIEDAPPLTVATGDADGAPPLGEATLVIRRLSSLVEQLATTIAQTAAAQKCCCCSFCVRAGPHYLMDDMTGPVVGGEGDGSHACQKRARVHAGLGAATSPARGAVTSSEGSTENPLFSGKPLPPGRAPAEATRQSSPPAALFADGEGGGDPADRMPPLRGGKDEHHV